jgi:hypothetical protein
VPVALVGLAGRAISVSELNDEACRSLPQEALGTVADLADDLGD